jgi:hypothetical protein
MKNLFLTTAVALSLAAPAFASDQLALSLGVEPGVYTTAELADLSRAYEENDQTRINFILSGGSNLDAATIERRGTVQAIGLAIEQGDYTHAQNLRANLSTPSDGTLSSRGTADLPAYLVNVANTLNVNAADFTVGELTALARYHEEGDSVRVQGLINRVTN